MRNDDFDAANVSRLCEQLAMAVGNMRDRYDYASAYLAGRYMTRALDAAHELGDHELRERAFKLHDAVSAAIYQALWTLHREAYGHD